MRIGSLGTCLVLSVVINLVGFAPFMSYLLGKGETARPAPKPPVQVRLLNARMDSPKQPSPVVPAPEPDKPAPAPSPKEKPKLADLPKDVKPVKNDLPDDLIPQARTQPKHHPKAAKPAQATPSGPLTRPDDKSNATLPPPGTGNSAPFTSPSNGTVPGPANDAQGGNPPATETPGPSPTPSGSPSPLTENTNTQPPAPPPQSDGNNPNEGAVPEKPASSTSFPPNQNSRPVLRKLRGKSLVWVGLKIYPDGHVDSQIVLSSGNSELDAAVLKDMKEWKWNPAELGGKPILSERVIKLKLEAD